MALYESVVIARQDLSTTQVDTLADDLTKILSEGGAKVTKRESWGLRSLTFRVKKNRKGHYVLFNLDAPAAAIQEYERRMRINEDVLRYLTVKVETLEEGPSAVLQNKDRGEREERPGGFGGGRALAAAVVAAASAAAVVAAASAAVIVVIAAAIVVAVAVTSNLAVVAVALPAKVENNNEQSTSSIFPSSQILPVHG